MKRITLVILAASIFGTSNAQDKQALEVSVQTRTTQLTELLGLDEKQAAIATQLVSEAESDVAPMRAECESIQKKVDAAYGPYYDRLESSLSPAQREKLAQLRKNGGLGSGCGHMDKAGCDHAKGTTDAKAAGGCCAGGKAKTTSTGLSTPEPSKTAH